MANLPELPTAGQKPWNLNPHITAMNAELNGRLSDNTLSAKLGGVVNAGDPKYGGLVADGVISSNSGTNNYSALRAAALDAIASKKALFIPSGVYRCDGTIPWQGVISGAGRNATQIFTTVADTPVIATRTWMTEFAGTPAGRSILQDITVWGAGTSSGVSGHGVVLRDYYTTVQNVVIRRCGGHGLLATRYAQNGLDNSANGGTLVGNVFDLIEIKECALTPMYLGESGSQMTDGFATRLELVASPTGTSENAFYLGQAAGWQVDKVHTYLMPSQHAINIANCWHTMVGALYVETYPSGFAAVNVHVQGECIIDAITADASQGRTVVRAVRPAVLANSKLHIGFISTRNEIDSDVVLVTNTASALDISVVNWMALGTYASRVKLQAGSGTTQKVNSLRGVRNSEGLFQVDRGDGLEVLTPASNFVNWNGSDSKSIDIPLPPLDNNRLKTIQLSIFSRGNWNGGVVNTWTAMVYVTSKDNATNTWTTHTVDVVAPTGFTTNPVVTAVKDSGRYGKLTVTFQSNNTNAYGAVTYVVN